MHPLSVLLPPSASTQATPFDRPLVTPLRVAKSHEFELVSLYAACHLENGRREQVRRDNQYARQCFPTALNDSTQRARVQERVGMEGQG